MKSTQSPVDRLDSPVGAGAGSPSLDQAGVNPDDHAVAPMGRRTFSSYIEKAKTGRLWDREPPLRRHG